MPWDLNIRPFFLPHFVLERSQNLVGDPYFLHRKKGAKRPHIASRASLACSCKSSMSFCRDECSAQPRAFSNRLPCPLRSKQLCVVKHTRLQVIIFGVLMHCQIMTSMLLQMENLASLGPDAQHPFMSALPKQLAGMLSAMRCMLSMLCVLCAECGVEAKCAECAECGAIYRRMARSWACVTLHPTPDLTPGPVLSLPPLPMKVTS